MMKPSIGTIRVLAARAGVDAQGMNAKQVRLAYDAMQKKIMMEFGCSLVDQHTCLLEEYLTRAGA